MIMIEKSENGYYVIFTDDSNGMVFVTDSMDTVLKKVDEYLNSEQKIKKVLVEEQMNGDNQSKNS